VRKKNSELASCMAYTNERERSREREKDREIEKRERAASMLYHCRDRVKGDGLSAGP
jgi:hypothetical protein